MSPAVFRLFAVITFFGNPFHQFRVIVKIGYEPIACCACAVGIRRNIELQCVSRFLEIIWGVVGTCICPEGK